MSRIGIWLGFLCLLSSIAGVFGQEPPPGPPAAQEPDPERVTPPTPEQLLEFTRRSRALAVASRVPFANPPEIHSGRGVLQTTLVVNYANNRIGQDRVFLRSYNGFLVGPTLRVQPNDRLFIRLLNDLPPEPAAALVHDINIPPHGSNTTNLHTHGFHVSPEDNGDNPLLEIPPNGRQDFDIRLGASNSPDLAVPGHPPGTHFYHPHKHGSAAIQLASGMVGALIVEGGLDDVEQIKAARERIFVIQQIPYSDSDPATVEGKAGFMRIRDWTRITNRYTTINGLLKPVIEMAPKEVERWRFIHAGLAIRVSLAVKSPGEGKPGLDFHEIAEDGIALGRIDREPRIDLTPGVRSDVLIKAPDEPGEYFLVKLAQPPEPGAKVGTGEDTLARIVVRGPANPMALPDPKTLAGLAPFRDVGAVQKTRALTFDGQGGTVWTVNNKQFNPDRTDISPVLGTAEEWTVTSLNQAHPFHIHVNPFQVLSIKDKEGREKLASGPVWRDTVMVDEGHTVRFRTRFEDFPGKTVLHCHKAEHEDQGMMQLVRILPQSPGNPVGVEGGADYAADAPQAAPAWRLPDEQGVMHELREFAGKRLVLVFFRGMGCPHCVEQLRELADRHKALDMAGIVVVAIGSDPLKPGGATAGQESDWPFLILADRRSRGLQAVWLLPAPTDARCLRHRRSRPNPLADGQRDPLRRYRPYY